MDPNFKLSAQPISIRAPLMSMQQIHNQQVFLSILYRELNDNQNIDNFIYGHNGQKLSELNILHKEDMKI